MNNHIYTVEILFKDGSVHSSKNMNIIHDYAESCEDSEKTLAALTAVSAVSVNNELGVTVFYKDRAAALCEVEGFKVIADEIAEFFHKVHM